MGALEQHLAWRMREIADLHCHGSPWACAGVIIALQQSDGRLRARNGRVRDSMLTLLSLRTLQRGERMLATYRGALRQAHDAMIGTSACANA